MFTTLICIALIGICLMAIRSIYGASEIIPGVNEPGLYRKLKNQDKEQ